MDTVLSVVVLAAVFLVAGAAWLWRRVGLTKHVWLMLVLAMVMIANVLLWTLPNGAGMAPADLATAGER